MQTDRGCEILSGDARAAIAVARVAKVRVAIDVRQTKAPARRESEARSDEKAAVPTDHEWSVAAVDDVPNPVGEATSVIDYGPLVANVTGFACEVVVDVPTREDDTAIGRTGRQEACKQAGVAQSLRGLRCSGHAPRNRRSKPQVCGCRNEDDH
jgi:hypothetical protein